MLSPNANKAYVANSGIKGIIEVDLGTGNRKILSNGGNGQGSAFITPNKALLSDKIFAALQICRRARRYNCQQRSNMSKVNFIFSGILVFILFGCASAPSGDQFSSLISAPPGKALVYLYRPNAYYGKAITYPVLLNGEKIADIGNRGYFTLELEPGDYSIRPDTDSIDHDLSISLHAGSTTFLKLKTNRKPALCFCTSLQFETVSEAAALIDLKDTKEEIDRVYYKK